MFIIYINHLPLTINNISKQVIFADDTRVVTSNRNFEDFCSMSNLVLSHIIKWFTANSSVLNLDKTDITKLIIRNSVYPTLHIGHKEK